VPSNIIISSEDSTLLENIKSVEAEVQETKKLWNTFERIVSSYLKPTSYIKFSQGNSICNW
jgi:hypothetical protein